MPAGANWPRNWPNFSMSGWITRSENVISSSERPRSADFSASVFSRLLRGMAVIASIFLMRLCTSVSERTLFCRSP